MINASASIYGFSYTGVASSLGGALTTELATAWPGGGPSTSGSCTALIFGMVENVNLTPHNISITQFSNFFSGLTYGTGLVYAGATLNILGLITVFGQPGMFTQLVAQLNAQLSAAASLTASASITPPTLAVTLAAVIRPVRRRGQSPSP